MTAKIVQGIISVFLGKFGVLIIGMITTPIIARILGPARYGNYAFLLSIFAILSIFASTSIKSSTRKFLSENRNMSNWNEHVFNYHAKSAVVLSIIVIILILLSILTGVVAENIGDTFNIYLIMICLLIASHSSFSIVWSSLMSFNLEHYSETLRLIRIIAFALIGITLAYLNFGIPGLLLGKITGALIASIVGFYILRRHISFRYLFQTIPENFPKKEVFRYQILIIIFVLFMESMYHIDIILLQMLSNSEQTGFYKAALQATQFVWFAPMAIQIVFLHSMSQLWSEEKYEEIDQISSKVTRFTLIFSLLLVIGIASLSSPFILLYFGEGFTSAVTPLLILLPGVLCFAVARPIFAVGQGIGKLTILTYGTGFAATLNLILNLVLIPPYGMVGAALATSTGYSSMLLIHIITAKKIGYNPIQNMKILRIAITALIFAPIIFTIENILQSAILSLIIVPPVGFVIYAILTILTGSIEKSEITVLRDQIPYLD